ncbi:MAG: hypothetical protein ACI89J_000243 [Hyphomicrobiaceae bacterium]|jgi:hypothetical protein
MTVRSVLPSVLAGLICVATVLALTTPADAARRRGGKVCMADHFHYGSSSGERNKKRARREAIASWAGFTAFEYGNAWARFRLARSKVVRCSRSDSGWGCSIEAVPCRRR